MLDPAIQSFLNERKELWLKKRITNNTSDEEKADYERQALEEFSLAKWLPDAAKRARQLSAASHPGKFSHPDAKISSIIAQSEKKNDGFLRSGNVEAELDVYGNAAALDVYKLLNIRLADNQTVLSHLEQQTSTIKQQLDIPGIQFNEIAQGLLAIKNNGTSAIRTSEKIKQVYFPVDHENYHLLSILTSSSLIFKLKERINILRFSDQAKAARDARKDNRHFDGELPEIRGLSVIGFGGTKPQNISVLNSQNGGTAYLLASMPPELQQRSIQPPKTNFFGSYLGAKAYQEEFQQFHGQLLKLKENNNIHMRNKRDGLIRNIIYQVADRLWQIRYLDGGWSKSETYRQLPTHQKIWLDQFYADERTTNTNYLTIVKQELASWFVKTYSKILSDQALGLGDQEMPHIHDQIERCEEALR
jgi:CRISPR-associated protein Csy1